MTRKSQTEAFKNPVAQALGLALQALRRAEGLSASEVADILGMGHVTYRLVEAGGAPLQSEYSLRLVRRFGDVDWSHLVQILAVIQMLQRGKEDVRLMAQIAEDLKALGQGLEALLERLEPIWSAIQRGSEAKDVARLLREHNLVDGLLDYLKQRAGPADGSGTHLPSSLDALAAAVSPYYFDMVAEQLARFQYFPPFVTPQGLRLWERNNQYRIARLYGIVQEPALLTGSLDLFDWPYLWSSHFKGAFICVTDPGADIGRIQREFFNQLVDLAPRSPTIARGGALQHLKETVVLRKAPRADQERLRTLLSASQIAPELLPPATRGAGRSQAAWQYRNAWFYCMADPETVVAFADESQSIDRPQPATVKSYVSTMLSWRSTTRLLGSVEEFWRDELKARRLKPVVKRHQENDFE